MEKIEEILKNFQIWHNKDAEIEIDDCTIMEYVEYLKSYSSQLQPNMTTKELTPIVMKFINWLHDNTDDTRVEDDSLWWIIPLEDFISIKDAYSYWLKISSNEGSL